MRTRAQMQSLHPLQTHKTKRNARKKDMGGRPFTIQSRLEKRETSWATHKIKKLEARSCSLYDLLRTLRLVAAGIYSYHQECLTGAWARVPVPYACGGRYCTSTVIASNSAAGRLKYKRISREVPPFHLLPRDSTEP